VLAVGSTLALGGTAWAEPPCSAELRGRVLDVQSLSPVTDARVTVPGVGSAVESGPDGRFRLRVPCADTWTVVIEHAGFRIHRESWSARADGDHLVYLLPATTESLRIQGHAVHDAELHPRAATVLEGEDLRRVRGRDLARSLITVPGVSVQGSGAISKPIIHGLGADRLLILQDGVRLESQDWGLDHEPEVDPFGAEQVVVTRGADAVRYGPGAIGGVIALSAAPYPERPSIRGEGQVIGMSNGRGGAANLSMQARLPGAADGVAMRGQLSYSRLGALEAPRYVLDNTAREVIGYSMGASVRISPRVRFELSGRGYRSDFGLFTDIRDDSFANFERTFTADLPPRVDFFRFDYDFDRPRIRVRHHQAKASATIRLAPHLDLETWYAFQTNDRREFDVVRGPLMDSAQGSFRLDTHLFDVHVDARLDDISLELGTLLTAARNEYEGVRFLPDYDKRGLGGYFIGHFTRPRYEIEAGVRFDYEGFDTLFPGQVVGTSLDDLRQLPDEEDDLDYFNVMGSLGGIWRFEEVLSVRGQLAIATRNPSPPELFAAGRSVGVALLQIGDRTLGPETTFNGQLTLQFDTDRVRGEATGFVHWIPGYIFLAPSIDASGEPVTIENGRGPIPVFAYQQVDARFFGGDLNLEVDPWKWLTLEAAGSLVRARDLSNDRFLVYVPADRLRLRATVHGRRWAGLRQPYAFVEGLAIRRQNRFDLAADLAPPPDGTVIGNLGFGFAFTPAPLYLDVEVLNFTHRTYREYLSRLRYFADEPGVSAFVRLSAPFDVSFN
jgi:iron complex outermembrane receptor protein